jgi:hypothetical protein
MNIDALRTMAVVLVAISWAACSKEPTRAFSPAPETRPVGWLDDPKPGPVSGKTFVNAWAISDVGAVTKAEILMDGQPAPVTLKRIASPWVCEKFPKRSGCEKAKYVGYLDFSGVTKGEHTLVWRVTNTGGHTAELGKRTVVVQ